MANCILGAPIYSDAFVGWTTPTFSGGNWLAGLPLTNLQDRRLGKVARSTNDDAASTQFDVDLKTARSLRVFGLINHNMSLAATVRIRGSNAAGDFSSPTYDSTTLPAFHASLTAEDVSDLVKTFTHVAAAATTASRYWRIEITDTTNPDNYVQIGRLALCAGYQPTINMEAGARIGWETSTARTETDGGAAVYNVRPRRRAAQFVLTEIPEAEALTNGWEFMRRLGTAAQLYFVWDPTDTTHLHRRAFLGVMRQLSLLQMPEAGTRYGTPFEIVEELP